MLVLNIVACRSTLPVTNSIVRKDSTITSYVRQSVAIKGAKVERQLNLDSLLSEALHSRKQYLEDSLLSVKEGRAIPPQPKTEVRYFTDPDTKAALSYWTDQYGKLNIGCESKDQTIQLLIAQVKQLHTELSTAVKIEYKTPWYNYLIILTLLAALLLTIIKK